MSKIIDAEGLYDEIYNAYDYEFPTMGGAVDEFMRIPVANIINNREELPTIQSNFVCAYCMNEDKDESDYPCNRCQHCAESLAKDDMFKGKKVIEVSANED